VIQDHSPPVAGYFLESARKPIEFAEQRISRSLDDAQPQLGWSEMDPAHGIA
jgi:hypothetical protein